MPIFDFLSGQFIDVIEWTDDSRDTLVHRFERHGHEIKYGAKLTVREGQAAVFIHEGQLADVFMPGLYMLETNNMPIMTTLQHWDHGFRSPFKSEIYFVSTTRMTDLKWGTKNPITSATPNSAPSACAPSGPMRSRSRPGQVHDRDRRHRRRLHARRDPVPDPQHDRAGRLPRRWRPAGSRFSTWPPTPTIWERSSPSRSPRRSPNTACRCRSSTIENVSLPPAVEEALDKRTSMGVLGDLDRYREFATAEAMQDAATTPNSAAWAWVSAPGMGMAMGNMMGGMQSGPWGARPAQQPQAAPPPPPVEHVWHIAESGQTKGPFSKARLGRMAAEGEVTRETLVWTQGQDGWMRAEDVDELAQLFTVMPPPPPPPAPGA